MNKITPAGHMRIDLDEFTYLIIYSEGSIDFFSRNEADAVDIDLPYDIKFPIWMRNAIRAGLEQHIEYEKIYIKE